MLVPLLLPYCEDWVLPALTSLPLVHVDCKALCRVWYLDCSSCQVGLGSLLLVAHCKDLALRLPAVASLPLVHADHEGLCRVCHLDCSPCLDGLGSLLLLGYLVGRIKFLLLTKK